MADKPTQADVKIVQALDAALKNVAKSTENLNKTTTTYGKTSKKVTKEQIKNLNGVDDALNSMEKEVVNLNGSLKKISMKGASEEAVKYHKELKTIEQEIIKISGQNNRGHLLAGAALKEQNKKVMQLQKSFTKTRGEIKKLEGTSKDWNDVLGDSGPTFARNWAKFSKAAEEGKTPIQGYEKILGKAGGKLGEMPGLFKAAGGAAKGLGSVLGGVTKMLAGWPGLVIGAVKAVVDLAMAADQFTKDANKAFATLRGPDVMGGGDVKKQFKEFNDQIFNAGENIRVGLDVSQIRELMLATRDAGLNITSLNKGLLTYRDAIYTASKASKTLGLELPMIGNMMGKMMADMRMDLDQMDKAFVQVAFDASKSGLSADRFWTTVQNASASLALYGTVVKSASGSLKAFTENMVGGADDAAGATENMFEVFKTGSLEAQMSIIDFAKQGGANIPKIFGEMAEEAAGRVQVIKGEIGAINLKQKDSGTKTSEEAEQLKKLRSELYAQESKQERFQLAAKGDTAAQAAEAGALAKRAPKMVLSALRGQIGIPLHLLRADSKISLEQAASQIGQSKQTVDMLIELSKVTAKRMDAASKDAAKFSIISGKDNSAMQTIFKNKIDALIKADGSTQQANASQELVDLMTDKLGMMPTMASDMTKLMRNDKSSAEKIMKIIATGDGNMASQIQAVVSSNNSVTKMTDAHFTDQEQAEKEVAKAADKTFEGIVKQTLSYNEMIKIAKDEVQWRLASMKLMSYLNTGVWSILKVISGNKPYLTAEQQANKELLKSKGVEVKEDKKGNILLSDLGAQIKKGVEESINLEAGIEEQNKLIGALKEAQTAEGTKKGSGKEVLDSEMKRVDNIISDLKGKDQKKMSFADKKQLAFAEKTKEALTNLTDIPALLKATEETRDKNIKALTVQGETNTQLTSLNDLAEQTAIIQREMLMSSDGGKKRIASLLKGKDTKEVYETASALGLSEADVKSSLDSSVAAGETDSEVAEEMMKAVTKGFKKRANDEKRANATTGYLDTGNMKLGEKKKDFYDITKGGFVNVQSGDILVDKNSLAQGTGGPRGAAIPAIAEASGASKAGSIGAPTTAGGSGTTINIQVTATESDLAGKIANEIKRELYNRQISTSSYS